MATLLATARELLRSRVQPHVSGETEFQTAMIANAIVQVARALEHPGNSWSALPHAATVSSLRTLVARRLAVINRR